MSELRVVDLTGLSPVDFLGKKRIWPGTPQKMGAYMSDSGLQSFASRRDYIGPVDITVCDSDPRIHLSVWLCDGVEIRAGGVARTINGLDSVAGYLPGIPIETRVQGKAHHVGLMFSPDTLRTLAGDDGERFFERLHRHAGLHIAPCDSQTLRTAHELDQLLLSTSPAKLLCEAKSLELLGCFLLRQQSCAAISKADKERLRHARELLLSDIASPPTTAELARASGINTLKLKRGFKVLYGFPIHTFYQKERMRIAWERVHEGEMSITEIGASVGYHNLSHFSAAFVRQFGMLPSTARKLARTFLVE
ncbi:MULTISPECIES: helix-turn-helix domain-containing protein [Halomonas]|uniref:helix-turn-helix domain-containing protein n=1 Tax=Halomonas TaxID=2745 RepID=UPI000BB7FA2C|nr:AraC family transcriptional regulator [Halomonas sp. JB37]PCC21605.1 hypothetical protein CIK78_05700 [Halomonas sp. JB37]